MLSLSIISFRLNFPQLRKQFDLELNENLSAKEIEKFAEEQLDIGAEYLIFTIGYGECIRLRSPDGSYLFFCDMEKVRMRRNNREPLEITVTEIFSERGFFWSIKVNENKDRPLLVYLPQLKDLIQFSFRQQNQMLTFGDLAKSLELPDPKVFRCGKQIASDYKLKALSYESSIPLVWLDVDPTAFTTLQKFVVKYSTKLWDEAVFEKGIPFCIEDTIATKFPSLLKNIKEAVSHFHQQTILRFQELKQPTDLSVQFAWVTFGLNEKFSCSPVGRSIGENSILLKSGASVSKILELMMHILGFDDDTQRAKEVESVSKSDLPTNFSVEDLESLHAAYGKKPRCSNNAISDDEGINQGYYECDTCWGANSQMSCCIWCRFSCHRGHKVIYHPPGKETSFCDCGLNDHALKCTKFSTGKSPINQPLYDCLDCKMGPFCYPCIFQNGACFTKHLSHTVVIPKSRYGYCICQCEESPSKKKLNQCLHHPDVRKCLVKIDQVGEKEIRADQEIPKENFLEYLERELNIDLETLEIDWVRRYAT